MAVTVKEDIPGQIIIAVNFRLYIVAVQIIGQVDKLRDTVTMFVDLNERLIGSNGSRIQFIQLRSQIVQFIQTVALPNRFPDTVNIALDIGNIPVGRTNFQSGEHIPQMVRRCGERYPFSGGFLIVQRGEIYLERYIFTHSVKLPHRSDLLTALLFFAF